MDGPLDMLEEEVFAIAFDQGKQDVIFHVINNGDKSTSLRQYSKRADDNASVTSSQKRKTVAAAFSSDAAFNSDLGAVNIEINPFALVPPHMDDYDHYTKGYTHATSLFASDSSVSTSAASTPSMMSLADGVGIAYDIVGHILEEVMK